MNYLSGLRLLRLDRGPTSFWGRRGIRGTLNPTCFSRSSAGSPLCLCFLAFTIAKCDALSNEAPVNQRGSSTRSRVAGQSRSYVYLQGAGVGPRSGHETERQRRPAVRSLRSRWGRQGNLCLLIGALRVLEQR